MEQNNDLDILKGHLHIILRPVDTEEVQKSSEILQEIFTKPECIHFLMQLMINEEEQNMRQIACVYIRSYLTKLWPKLDNETKEGVKTALLERYEQDPSPLIKKSIAGVIGSLGRLLIPDGEWNQPFEFVMTYYSNDNIAGQELSLLLLSYLIEYLSKEDIKNHFDDIATILSTSLKSTQSSVVDFSIKWIKNCANATSNVKVLKSLQSMIPDMLNTLSEENEERVQAVLDCLTSLVEYKGLLTPHLPTIIDGAIKIAENQDLHLHTRQRAILFFEFVPLNNAKMFKKKKQLLDTIIKTLMKIACEPEDEYPKEEEAPSRYALFAMKSFSIYMHKPVIFPVLIKYIKACIDSTAEIERKAGVELLGFICESEACLDPIKDHIDEITDVIVKWLYDESVLVKATTAETVGMFSENVSDFLYKTDKVIPAIVDTLKYLSDTDIPLQKALHALHSFVNGADYGKITEMMDDMIPMLMHYLSSKSHGVQKWTMEIISSVVIAADTKIEAYFDALMEPCQAIFKNTPLKVAELKSQALDTIGHLAKAVGRERFEPYLEYYSQAAIETLQNQEYHSMREAAFSYFCSISKFMKSEMASILPILVEQAFITIDRNDIKIEKGSKLPQDFSLDSDSEKEQEFSGKVEAFDEKASAINCLGYIFKFCPVEMFAFVSQIGKMILTMIQYVEENVRFECVTALNHVTIGLNKLDCGEEFNWEVGFTNPTPIGDNTQAFLKEVYFPCLATIFDTEDENDVIERMLQSLIEITEELGSAVYIGRLDQILTLINNLLENPNNAGEGDNEGDFEDMGEDDGEEDIDHNETVISNVTELISAISRVMGEDFAEHFEKQTGELLFTHCGENYPMRDQSICIGTLGECFNNMPSLLKKWFNQFYKCIMTAFKSSKDDELVRNWAFALGVCAELQPKLMKPKIKEVLKIINSVADNVKEQGAKDNIVSALFKISTYNYDSVPFKSMAASLFEAIPLQDDLDENESISKWWILLFGQVEKLMKPYMTNVLKTIMWAVIEKESLTKDPIRRELAGWLKNITTERSEYAEIIEALSAPLTEEQRNNFAKFCS